MATIQKTTASAISSALKSRSSNSAAAAAAQTSLATASSARRQLNAVVVSAGLMQKTVKVRIGVQKWNSRVRKDFNRTSHLLVHDPNSSLRLGDVISITPGWRVSKHVRHVVDSIIAPFGVPLEERPPVLSEAERIAEREEKMAAKVQRRKQAARREMEEEGEEKAVRAGKKESVVQVKGNEETKKAKKEKKENKKKERAVKAVGPEGEGQSEVLSENQRNVEEPAKKRGWFS